MMEKILSRSIRVICLGGMALGMQAAYAQEAQPQSMQRVEVTGSRIRAVDLETSQPVQVMTQEQIQKSGLVTVGDILNNLSSAGAPDFSKGGSLVSNRENGGQYINLRNLGSNRLLVLVDGKRWTQTVDGYTDLSTIPSSMVERMEVLKDGASAVYGSDAIAGVVNIILKKKMEGGQLSVYEGANQKHGDAKAKDFSLTYGASNDKASLMFGLSHTEQGVVWANSRDITSTSYGPAHATAALGTGPWGRIAGVSATGGADTSVINQVLNHTGTYDGVGTGSNSRDPNSYHKYTGAAADKFNSTSQMMFNMPNRLDTIFTKGVVNLRDDLRFTTTAMFSQRTAEATVAGYPLNSTSQSTFPVYVDKDSYFNPYGNQVAGAGKGQDLYFWRRTIEVPRNTESENRTLHIDAGFEGEFAVRGLPWNWDVNYNHSAVNGSTLSTGNLNLVNLKKALGPSFMNASGVVQCGTAAKPVSLTECVPFNILGGPSASTPAALQYVMSTGQATYGSTVNSATANIGGELYTLPAGALSFAAGYEHRSVSGYDRPGQFEQSGYSTDLAGNPTYGKYNVKEAYAELRIPVLAKQFLAEKLVFDLATRHSDYSNFGSTNNSKISFEYKPVKDLLTRGTWAQGFRAPYVGDTFGGGQQSFDTYLDPCDTKYGSAAKDPAVAARCAAAGVPANFRQLTQTGTALTNPGGAQGAYPFQAGAGNASLQPETAYTRTVGFVYSPSWLPGFSGSLDWYRININNRITGVSATYVANQCYVAGVSSFCGSIKRDPITGEITALARGNANLGKMETEGLDLSLDYRFPRSKYGQFTIHNETSYVNSFKIKSTDTSDWQEYAGEYFYNRVKSNTQLNWTLGNWGATWGVRYYSPTKDQCWDTDVECSNPGMKASWGTDVNKIGSVMYHDLNVSYKTSWNGKVMFGMNNVFDKQPRIVYQAGAQASSSSVDPDQSLGRFFYVRYNQSF
ncbi:TonB-dependent receptor [Massilia solisilvae]|uniref:TonB-dependent receptor n=1 Tax=Massilia solisilvae TaxID=1811225 RepID=A0ABT2BIC6_9BURK|nr:TonB-dependent receptor [Massilia solisilvae]MCS0608269.1 TonB-dependent receptor [Massilia solisilvae]